MIEVGIIKGTNSRWLVLKGDSDKASNGLEGFQIVCDQYLIFPKRCNFVLICQLPRAWSGVFVFVRSIYIY